MSTHPRLVWPRSDGDKANWPDLKPSKPGGAWFEPISQNHIKYDNYEERAGEHLAGVLGIPKRPNGLLHRIPMPSGFKMFVHKQPRPTGEVREDFYCFGSNHNKRIRSAQEWKDHAEWLFSDKPFERHNSECGCFAKKGSRLAEASGSTPIKRPAVKAPVSASVPKAKKQRLSPVEPDEDVGPTGVAPERGHDLKYQRRFRRGELIWVRIDTIFPPPGTDLPEITHWPVLVADVRLRIHTPAPNPPATLADAAAPANPGATSHYWTYHLRPLGMFSRKDDIVRDIKDMLPWALGDELMGGQSGWQALAREGTRVLKAGVSKEAEEEKEKKSDTLYKDRWETNWAPRIKFADMGLNWEVAAVRIGVAIKTGILIARSWCQTDRIDIIGETILSTADRDLVDQGKKNFYQGLWLGGERIWAEDLVRLKKDRKELPPDLGAPETGAETRAVFLKIRAISLEKDETSDKQDIWRCIVSGDISELVQSATYHQSTWAVDETSTPLVQNYKAAKGYKYRQLHETGCEVSCDSSDIAGRVYPDLLDPETQNWYSLNDEEPIAEGRHAPGKVAQALVGIQPGTVACSSPKTWIEDLFAIVDAACKDAEKSARDFYVKEMEHALGKQGTPKKRKVDPIADSSTASTAATGTAGDGPAATLAAPGSAVSISATPVAPTSINGPTENNANGTTNAPSSTTIQTASAASVLNGAPPPAPAGVAAPAPAPARQSFPEVQFTPLAGVPNAARVGQP